MRWRRTSRALLVVVAFVALAPLADANPPDPTWLAGFWDNSDHDDVVILASSAVSVAKAQAHSTLALFSVGLSPLRVSTDGVLRLAPLPPTARAPLRLAAHPAIGPGIIHSRRRAEVQRPVALTFHCATWLARTTTCGGPTHAVQEYQHRWSQRFL